MAFNSRMGKTWGSPLRWALKTSAIKVHKATPREPRADTT